VDGLKGKKTFYLLTELIFMHKLHLNMVWVHDMSGVHSAVLFPICSIREF